MLKQKCIGIVLLTVCCVGSSFGQEDGYSVEDPSSYGSPELPVAYVPMAEDPAVYTGIADEPVTTAPMDEQPVTYPVVADDPTHYTAMVENAITDVGVVEDSITFEAMGQDPINYVAMADGPMPYHPTVNGPMNYGPMNYGPMVEGPTHLGPMGPINAQGDFDYIQSSVEGEYIQVPAYEMPTVKFTLDGVLFNRIGESGDQPLIRTEPFGPAAISSGDIGFDNRLGGRAELLFYSAPHRVAPRASVLWTGTELSRLNYMAPEGSTADVSFFQARAAEPSPGYTLRNRSRFTFADIGLRRTVSPAYGFSASLAYGRIVESMDWVSRGAVPQNNGGVGGGPPGETGFFSQVDNRLYGLQLGTDVQIWTNGYLKLDGNATVGYFYNDVKAGAQSLNEDQEWNPDNESLIATANLSLVIPADPVNFRIGYQGAFLTGIALPGSYTRELNLFDGSGEPPTDKIWYHGLTIGIEYLR